jgi:hypothetical protein
MSEQEIKIEIVDKVLICSIPLISQEGSDSKAKMITYGALKLAEEQASIFYMQRAMQRQALLRNNGIIKPGLA